MNRREYCDRVLSVLRYVTPAEKTAILEELDAHIEDHMCHLLERGYTEELAEARTMACMGDPEEVGRALDRQYPLHWLVISRFVTVFLVLAIFMLLSGLLTMNNTFDSFRARWAPWTNVSERWEESIHLRLDLRQEVGSDVVRVLGSGAGEKWGKSAPTASVLLCQYDQNPFGYVSRMNIYFEDCRGETVMNASSGYSSSGAAYSMRDMYVQYGDPYVTMVCERYGIRYEIEVPLVWEDAS